MTRRVLLAGLMLALAVLLGPLGADAQERSVLKEWTDQYGPAQGAEIFRGVKYKVRQVLLRRVAQAKQMKGYR